MTLDVEMVAASEAIVFRQPSFVARVVLGRKGEERRAVRAGGLWTWDDTGRLVDDATDRALRAAARAGGLTCAR